MPAIRDPGQRSALYPRVLPLLDGLPKALGGGHKGVKGDRGAIRPDRAPGPPDADARRGRGLQRRPQCRPARQGHPEEHRLRRRRRASDRRQQERSLRRRRPDPHPGKHPQPLVGGRPRGRVPDRLGRRLEPDGRRLITRGSIATPSRSSTRAATSSSRPPTCRPGGRRPRPRSAGPGPRGRPARGDGRADLGARQGGGDLQGPREVREGRGRRSDRRDPGDRADSGRRLAGRRGRPDARRPARLHQDDPAAGPDLRERARRAPARRLAGGLAPASTGRGEPAASWATSASG